MRKLSVLVLLFLILVLTTNFTVPTKKSYHPSIEGTWELINRYNYDGINITDTLTPATGFNQIKMFYNGKVMWTRYTPNQSVEWFGYGTYETTDSTLTERLEYMSASMRRIANENMEWHMELQLENNTYTQINLDEEGGRIASENYRRIN